MGSIRQYTPEENFRRIRRQRALKFIVVEGTDDVPIYESCLETITDSKNYDVVHSGGKRAIKDFIESHSTNNAVFIVDKDFNDIDLGDERLFQLDRYSIENYFICEDIISRTLKLVLNCKLSDSENVFDLDDFKQSISAPAMPLLKVIFYYQRNIVPNIEGKQFSWRNLFLCQNEHWELCPERIQDAIHSMLGDGTSDDDITNYYDTNFSNSDELLHDFPGKLLKTPIYRYLRSCVNAVKPNATSRIGNEKNLFILMAANIQHSKPLRKLLQPVAEFISQP